MEIPNVTDTLEKDTNQKRGWRELLIPLRLMFPLYRIQSNDLHNKLVNWLLNEGNISR